MNKKNKILVGCLALLLVLSVGYALFSETITINGTATAKGSFGFEYTCEVLTETLTLNENRREPQNGQIFTIKPGTGAGECEIVDGVIKTRSTLSKPGERVVFYVTIENPDGNIDAILKTIDTPNNYSSRTATSAGDVLFADLTTGLGATYELYARMYPGYYYQKFVGDSNIENAQISFPDDYLWDLIIYHEWADMGSNQPEIPEEGASISYDIKIGFEQVVSN